MNKTKKALIKRFKITKNGKILIAGQTFDTAEVLPMQETQTVPKSDKPVVELFIWSYCPYGVQAQGPLAEVAKLPQLIEGRSPIPGEYGWAYALQNGTVVISDSKQDENNYSGSLGPLEYKFSVTFPCGRDSYRREVYKTRPEAIILMMRESLATIKAMAW